MTNSSKQDITSRHSHDNPFVIQISISSAQILAAPINIESPNAFAYFTPMDHKISSPNTKLHIRPKYWCKMFKPAIRLKIASFDETKTAPVP